MTKQEPKKQYLTRKAISQRIGLTESSVETLRDIKKVLKAFTKKDHSRALLIRRAVEVYAEYLLEQYHKGLLSSETYYIEELTGIRGRPPKVSAAEGETSKATQGGI
ncbi:hypothetical protein [Amphritea sp. HPY]|uniref:hypothetical protein n=1 Tax=Amphritea sp. HPY TaxID=3421652 RepID=UPI003D7DAE6A